MMHFVSNMMHFVRLCVLKATKVYCYEQGCKSMLSIGQMIQQNRPFFDIGGDDIANLTRLQMSSFLPKMM